MKRVGSILVVALALIVTSCGAGKYMMRDAEIAEKGYSIDGWNIMKNGEVVGVLTTMEWELYKNKFYREISIKTSFSTESDMKDIARFVQSKFPESKIEVNEDGGNSFPKEQ